MPGSDTRPRILYIDDDPGIARLVQRHLERSGYAVTLAPDGDAGLAQARANGFAAIGLDHYMPGRDGLDLLAEFSRLAGAPPVIFCTGAEEPRIAVAALKNGAADYVVKDVQGGFLELLAASIGQEITRARLRRERDAAEQEVRESRDRLERLAAQQAMLLREVNHRVANSLQLICSLIHLQARKVREAPARLPLLEAADRVEAVAMVHRRLYTGQDVEFVELDAYLDGLVEELGRAGSGTGRDSQVRLTADPVRVITDKAVPIGLMVNELVTNAMKYAYPGQGGEIRVALRRHDAALHLTVEDDGVGYPADGSQPHGSGLGSLIVKSMAQTLQAEINLDRAHRGTRFVVSFPG